MTKSKQSALQRIQRIMKFNYNRGLNSERVNEIYRKIINEKLSVFQIVEWYAIPKIVIISEVKSINR